MRLGKRPIAAFPEIRPSRRNGRDVRWLWPVVLIGALGAAAVNSAAVRVVSSSMAETICPGDYVITEGVGVLRFPSRLREAFFAIRPGDIVVYRKTESALATDHRTTFLVKRVVATSGDRVRITDGHLRVNGVVTYEPYVLRLPFLGDHRESWPPDTAERITAEATVPTGAFFVLGDNRDESVDSRTFGPISASAIVGRVIAIVATGSRDTCLAG